MLNALDGVWTPHGMVTILTTNHRKDLDPALIRAGRVDVDEEFTVLDADQARRLAAQLDVSPADDAVAGLAGRSPADAMGVLRGCRRAGAAAAIVSGSMMPAAAHEHPPEGHAP
jgi:hypothetical protein